MADENDETSVLKPPLYDHPDDKLRAIAEAGIQLIPLGDSILRLVGEFAPTQTEKQRRRWETDVTSSVNDHASRIAEHDKIISPKITITGVCAKLIVALATAPGDGMRGRGRTPDDLAKLLPGEGRQAIQDAAFDLERLGLVTMARAFGNHWWLKCTPMFYEQVDPQVMGWVTRSDAVKLAKLLLEDEARSRTAILHEASGWEKRRFNPAFQMLLHHLPDGFISREQQSDYPSSSVVMSPEVIASLRRFTAGG